MPILVAIAHVAGAVLSVLAFGLCVMLQAGWQRERNTKAAAQEASLALDIPVSEFGKPEHQRPIHEYIIHRYSSKRLKDRTAQLVEVAQGALRWCGVTLQVAIVGYVTWRSVTHDPAISIYAWCILAVAVFFWLVSVALDAACKRVIGQYPGQRRSLDDFISEVGRRNGISTAKYLDRKIAQSYRRLDNPRLRIPRHHWRDPLALQRQHPPRRRSTTQRQG